MNVNNQENETRLYFIASLKFKHFSIKNLNLSLSESLENDQNFIFYQNQIYSNIFFFLENLYKIKDNKIIVH